ncbi:MAG TPA: UvrD-helicase domain-containing protein [Terriglobales bacterium]|nr:UvrD-helicase domain-containing protein [Terriglobales bacterium]
MEFRIADTFTDSLARLTGDEQKAAKMAAFDLQLNPAHPSLQLHKLDKAKDPNFWSIRVTRDLRIIVHRTGTSLLLCYVNHHDDAYQWAERRRLETHPKTGAAQLVEVRERVQEITIPKYVESEQPASKRKAFHNISEGTLLTYGVPPQWVPEVLNATEDELLEIAGHLPAEAAEALLNLATGIRPPIPEPVAPGTSPFEHPDALRRFRAMKNVEELALALDYPWERWAVFLHPEQRKLVEKDFSGPARVSGTAGTGKTIVALHRAAHLARTHPQARVLLTTFSQPLANALRAKLRLLLSSEPRLGERIEVYSMDAIGRRLYELNIGKLKIATDAQIVELLREASKNAAEHKFSLRFLTTEWQQVVDGWQLDSWEEYRDVNRLGRKTRLREEQRKLLWTIFERIRAGLRDQNLVTTAGMFNVLARFYSGGAASPFDFAVVDEAQDIGIAQVRFLAAMAAGRPNSLFFAGDLGQRIFQQPFSWKAAGADVRGRSTTLKINYRTSHQIRAQSDRLLDPEIADVDGIVEGRKGTVSLFNGPKPDIKTYPSAKNESNAVGSWLAQLMEDGIQPHEIALFVRSAAQLDRARAAAESGGIKCRILDEHVEISPGSLSVSTMHLAKGLEFRAVGVMACDDEVIPLQERIEAVADEADLEDIYSTERQLLYVACTRARDQLLVTSTEPASEFLEDMLTHPNI